MSDIRSVNRFVVVAVLALMSGGAVQAKQDSPGITGMRFKFGAGILLSAKNVDTNSKLVDSANHILDTVHERFDVKVC